MLVQPVSQSTLLDGILHAFGKAGAEHMHHAMTANAMASDRETAARVEAVFKDGEGKLAERLPELETHLDGILHVLGTALSGNAADAGSLADSPPGNPAVADELLVKLRELLEDDDSDALDIVESLLPHLAGRKEEATLRQIAGLIEDYDYEEALTQLDELEETFQ